jgi:hypothetical protein
LRPALFLLITAVLFSKRRRRVKACTIGSWQWPGSVAFAIVAP